MIDTSGCSGSNPERFTTRDLCACPRVRVREHRRSQIALLVATPCTTCTIRTRRPRAHTMRTSPLRGAPHFLAKQHRRASTPASWPLLPSRVPPTPIPRVFLDHPSESWVVPHRCSCDHSRARRIGSTSREHHVQCDESECAISHSATILTNAS